MQGVRYLDDKSMTLKIVLFSEVIMSVEGVIIDSRLILIFPVNTSTHRNIGERIGSDFI